MKQVCNALLLALCLFSLANCRRGGGMMGGGGPMEGAGPCNRCNQNRDAQNDFRRERSDPFDQLAPFPGENNNFNQEIDGNLVGSGNNIVQDENILGGNSGQQPFSGLPGLQAPVPPGTAIDPSSPGGASKGAVEAPAFEDDVTQDRTDASVPRETASKKSSTHN